MTPVRPPLEPDAPVMPINSVRLEAMIDVAVKQLQEGQVAPVVVPFRAGGGFWGGMMALAASIVLAVALAPVDGLGAASEDGDEGFLSLVVMLETLEN